MTFFCFDIETLGVESTSVILSVGITKLESNTPPYSFGQTIQSGLFVKFNAKEQIEKYRRKVEKETLDWWKEQSDDAKLFSFTPNKLVDIDTIEGIKIIHNFMSNNKDKKDIIWTRGSLDQLTFESLLRSVKYENFMPYWKWRDVRTAIDIIYGDWADCGYIAIDPAKCPDYFEVKMIEHHPVYDSARDLMMLVAGLEDNPL